MKDQKMHGRGEYVNAFGIVKEGDWWDGEFNGGD